MIVWHLFALFTFLGCVDQLYAVSFKEINETVARYLVLEQQQAQEEEAKKTAELSAESDSSKKAALESYLARLRKAIRTIDEELTMLYMQAGDDLALLSNYAMGRYPLIRKAERENESKKSGEEHANQKFRELALRARANRAALESGEITLDILSELSRLKPEIRLQSVHPKVATLIKMLPSVEGVADVFTFYASPIKANPEYHKLFLQLLFAQYPEKPTDISDIGFIYKDDAPASEKSIAQLLVVTLVSYYASLYATAAGATPEAKRDAANVKCTQMLERFNRYLLNALSRLEVLRISNADLAYPPDATTKDDKKLSDTLYNRVSLLIGYRMLHEMTRGGSSGTPVLDVSHIKKITIQTISQFLPEGTLAGQKATTQTSFTSRVWSMMTGAGTVDPATKKLEKGFNFRMLSLQTDPVGLTGYASFLRGLFNKGEVDHFDAQEAKDLLEQYWLLSLRARAEQLKLPFLAKDLVLKHASSSAGWRALQVYLEKVLNCFGVAVSEKEPYGFRFNDFIQKLFGGEEDTAETALSKVDERAMTFSYLFFLQTLYRRVTEQVALSSVPVATPVSGPQQASIDGVVGEAIPTAMPIQPVVLPVASEAFRGKAAKEEEEIDYTRAIREATGRLSRETGTRFREILETASASQKRMQDALKKGDIGEIAQALDDATASITNIFGLIRVHVDRMKRVSQTVAAQVKEVGDLMHDAYDLVDEHLLWQLRALSKITSQKLKGVDSYVKSVPLGVGQRLVSWVATSGTSDPEAAEKWEEHTDGFTKGFAKLQERADGIAKIGAAGA